MIITDDIEIIGTKRFTSKAGKDLMKVYYEASNDAGAGRLCGSFITGATDFSDADIPFVCEGVFGYDSLHNWGVIGIIKPNERG